MAGHMTGIGNYSYNLLRALAAHDELDFVGFSDFGWSGIDRATLDRVGQDHAKLSQPPARRSTALRLQAELRKRLARLDLARPVYRAARSFMFARTVRQQRLDLFHALAFVPPAPAGVPTLPCVYDLSFLRYPESHPKDRLRALADLQPVIARASLVHTISEFSKSEIHTEYGIPHDRILVAPPAAAAIFRPLGPEATDTQITAFGLSSSRYLLAVGTLEPRKNLRTLISAYSRLSPSEREQMPLVVAGGAGWGNIDLPQDAAALSSAGSLRLLGAVSDAQLRSLYEGAAALFFPSVYEGFGMPVVEAMSCGTPVVHSAATAMDEITADLALRIPALDVEAWSTAIRQVQSGFFRSDEEARAAREKQAARYDWAVSADVVRSAYLTLCRR